MSTLNTNTFFFLRGLSTIQFSLRITALPLKVYSGLQHLRAEYYHRPRYASWALNFVRTALVPGWCITLVPDVKFSAAMDATLSACNYKQSLPISLWHLEILHPPHLTQWQLGGQKRLMHHLDLCNDIFEAFICELNVNLSSRSVSETRQPMEEDHLPNCVVTQNWILLIKRNSPKRATLSEGGVSRQLGYDMISIGDKNWAEKKVRWGRWRRLCTFTPRVALHD